MYVKICKYARKIHRKPNSTRFKPVYVFVKNQISNSNKCLFLHVFVIYAK